MSVRFPTIGWMILGLGACRPDAESPLAPEGSVPPGVPVQAGPPPPSTNNLPTVMITTPVDGATVTAGTTVQLSADLTDPDVADTHTCYVDWQLAAGPGTVTESGGAGTCTASNVYSVPGTYQVVVSIIDQLGGTTADSIGITVAVTAPPPPPPPPSPTPSTGSIRGTGRLPIATGTVAGFAGTEAAVWFDVKARISKETNSLRGAVSVHVPKAHFSIVSAKVTKLDLRGTRADVYGNGKLNGRRRVSFVVCAVDGNQGERSTGTDRVRIRVWDEQGVIFDTDPGMPVTGNPTAVPKPGSIVIKP